MSLGKVEEACGICGEEGTLQLMKDSIRRKEGRGCGGTHYSQKLEGTQTRRQQNLKRGKGIQAELWISLSLVNSVG